MSIWYIRRKKLDFYTIEKVKSRNPNALYVYENTKNRLEVPLKNRKNKNQPFMHFKIPLKIENCTIEKCYKRKTTAHLLRNTEENSMWHRRNTFYHVRNVHLALSIIKT